MTENNVHSTRSSHREALLEHLFAGEVMKHLWQRGDWRLEVLKPQVDDSGCDVMRQKIAPLARFLVTPRRQPSRQ
jgi:hypothetical protein